LTCAVKGEERNWRSPQPQARTRHPKGPGLEKRGIKPSDFFPDEASDDMLLQRHHKAKLEGYVQALATTDT
jgi:hypothetical protein